MKEIKIKVGSLLSFLTVFAVVCSFTMAFAKNPVEIDIMHRWAGPRNVPFQKIIDNFLAKNPGVKVENIVVPGVYTNLETKILARAAAGEEPPSIIAPGYYLLLHSAKTFNPVVLGEMEGAEVVFSDFLPATLELGQIDNVQWALPFALSNPILFYNSKIFEQAGLDPDDPPRTWREVYLMSKIIKDKTKITAPVWPQILDTYFPQSLIESNGGHMVKNERAAFNSPEGVEAVRMWQELYKEGLSPKVKWDEGIEGFKFSKIAIEITSPSLIPIFAEAVPSVKTGEFPTFGSKPRRLASGGGCLMITAKNPEKRKAAWDLMKHMVSKQSMTIWATGTGYISPLDPAKIEIPMLDPRQKPAYEQLPAAAQWANWPGLQGLEAEKIFLDWMDKILFEGMDVEEGLNEAARIINEILSS